MIKNSPPLRVSAAHNRGDTVGRARRSAITPSALCPEYPVRGVEETISLICVRSLAGFPDGKLLKIPACRPGPICLKERTKPDAEQDLRQQSSTAATDAAEKSRRERYCATWNLRTKRTRWNYSNKYLRNF